MTRATNRGRMTAVFVSSTRTDTLFVEVYEMKPIIAVASVALLLSATALFAQLGSSQSDADPRVRKVLDQLGLNYDVDSDGDFKLIVETGDERTQLVFINSNTENLDPFEIREIWGPAHSSDGPFSREVANELLLDSFQKKLGAWQTMKTGDTYVAVFSAKVAAELDQDSLDRIIRTVAESADVMEKRVNGDDEY